jgi:short subunit dehydrogenase-like uncharacterized protein
MMGALGIVKKLLENKPKPGVYTPSHLMGDYYISKLPGSGPIILLVTERKVLCSLSHFVPVQPIFIKN